MHNGFSDQTDGLSSVTNEFSDMTKEAADPDILSDNESVSDMIAEYAVTRETIRWPVDAELEAAVKVSYRNRLATQLADKGADEIARKYVYLSDAAMTEMVDLVEQHVLSKPLHGVGIELGSGCGSLAAAVAKRTTVEAVFGLEVCENFDVLMEIVAASALGENASKVIPVIGSFDDLRIPDNSLDFAVEHDSLHHSDDLKTSMKECARVLKPGGVLICFDRCHPNSVSDDDVNEMLDHVYSSTFLQANGYPTDIVLTRRENGEHEYRLFEWQEAAQAAGLKFTRRCEFLKRVSFKKAAKGAMSIFPKPIKQAIFTSNNASVETARNWLSQKLGIIRSHEDWVLAPKRTTVLIITKPK